MICLRCDSEEFREHQGFITQEYRGKTLEVPTHLLACTKCGWKTVDLTQADELRANTKAVYNFEIWWETDYSHMDPANYGGTLAKNIIGVTKVIAKAAWLAALHPPPCPDCTPP